MIWAFKRTWISKVHLSLEKIGFTFLFLLSLFFFFFLYRRSHSDTLCHHVSEMEDFDILYLLIEGKWSVVLLLLNCAHSPFPELRSTFGTNAATSHPRSDFLPDFSLTAHILPPYSLKWLHWVIGFTNPSSRNALRHWYSDFIAWSFCCLLAPSAARPLVHAFVKTSGDDARTGFLMCSVVLLSDHVLRSSSSQSLLIQAGSWHCRRGCFFFKVTPPP